VPFRRRHWFISACACAILLAVGAPPAAGWLLALAFQASANRRAWTLGNAASARDGLALLMLLFWALFCVMPASVAWVQVRLLLTTP